MATILESYDGLGQEFGRLLDTACRMLEDAQRQATRGGAAAGEFDFRLLTLLTITSPFSRRDLDRNLRRALDEAAQNGGLG